MKRRRFESGLVSQRQLLSLGGWNVSILFSLLSGFFLSFICSSTRVGRWLGWWRSLEEALGENSIMYGNTCLT